MKNTTFKTELSVGGWKNTTNSAAEWIIERDIWVIYLAEVNGKGLNGWKEWENNVEGRIRSVDIFSLRLPRRRKWASGGEKINIWRTNQWGFFSFNEIIDPSD